MRTTQQLSITLPNEMADLVRAKVATGEYATESEVIRGRIANLACTRPRFGRLATGAGGSGL